MIKAIFFELDQIIVDLQLIRKKTWTQVFFDIDPDYVITSSLMKQLIYLNNSIQKVIFWEEFRKTNASLKIVNFKSHNLLEKFDNFFKQNLDNDLSSELVNEQFIKSIFNKISDDNFYIINNTPLSNLLYEKLNFKKKYPYLKLFLDVKSTKQIGHKSYLEDNLDPQLHDKELLLNTMTNLDCCFYNVIFILHSAKLIDIFKKIKVYIVGVDLPEPNPSVNLSLDWNDHELLLDKIIYEFHAKD